MIRFEDEWEFENGEKYTGIAQIYKHSDGYPKAIIEDLMELFSLLKKTQSYRDASYTASQFIFTDKLRIAKMTMSYHLNKKPSEITIDDILECNINQPMFLLGHGVENPSEDIYGDEEYLYIVKVSENKWYVKVSEHCGFPRYGEGIKYAFEKARWEFEGSLEEAYEKYCKKER